MNMKDRIERAYGGRKPPLVEAESAKQPPAPSGPAAARDGHPKARKRAGTKGPVPGAAPGAAPAASGPPEQDARQGAGAFIKTASEPGLARAAKFLLLLGADEAAGVVAHLPPGDVEKIAREILAVKSIDAIEANEILAEFGWLVQTKGYAIEGGPDTAERMLSAAFGPERARELLRKAAPETLRPFRFLNDFEPPELLLILKDESPQVLALILPYLEPKRASGLIERIPEPVRVEVVKRIARLEKVNPEILRRVEETLKDRIRRIGTVSSEEIDGKAALAGILRHVDPRLEEQVLGALAEESPEVSKDVRDRLFTLDDVISVPDRQLQKALREFQDRDIALVLKGRDEGFKAKILQNLSQGRRALVLDEYGILGAVRREDAAEAAREFLAWLKQAWDDGELILEGEDELVE